MRESFDYQPLYDILAATDLAPWIEPLRAQTHPVIFESNNGHIPRWEGRWKELPTVKPSRFDLNASAITIGTLQDLAPDQQATLKDTLKGFSPWRKGPYELFGTYIDTEWRSDWKWERIKDKISPLKDRLVLDVGCGNGYHCWRMAGEGAKLALGTDPSLLFVVQSFLMRKYLPDTPAFVLPYGLEELPPAVPVFDTVFSMGVLYHRRSPIDHLLDLKSHLRPGGELVLETIVVDGPEGYALVPESRYAQMRNTWFFPSPATLESWLKRCGYRNVRLIDLALTTTEEQRRTEWMTFYSLANYLDPSDPTKTVEGYPAPQRAAFVAEA